MSTAMASTTAISRTITHIAAILLAAACVSAPQPPGPERARYVQTTFSSLPGWRETAVEPSLRAFLAGCPRLSDALARVCARAPAAGDEPAARSFFESQFTPYALLSSLGAESNLITGYYEPIISGSRGPGAVHRYPIYGLPDDLVVVDLAAVNPDLRNMRLRGRLEGRRVVPYYSRAEIESRGGGLPAPVIAWTADPVELFFLQVQGSGQVQLDNGQRIRIGYADQNGHPYRSLGRHLIERGEMTLEQASMQGIQSWAAANPQKLQEALNANPSYVFFRELEAQEGGPIGALGIPLTPQLSLAVDRRFVPLGAPVWLSTTWPLSEQRLERLMAAQDTGGAIRGVARGDFYWGTGTEAGALAGRMRQQGRMWLLWPKGEPLPAGS
jgi:membrane-bound lytic murein transglycosylase A